MTFGVLNSEPIDVYHAADCLSKTKLDIFRHDPELYRQRFVSKEIPRDPPTPAMILGSAIGALVCEGEAAYLERFCVVPDDAPKRPTQKQINAKKVKPEVSDAVIWWMGFEGENKGKEIISEEDSALIWACRDSLLANKVFQDLACAGKPEVTFRIRGEHFNVQVRPDWWNEDGCKLTDGYPLVIDVKTIYDLPQDDDDFLPKHIASYGYHRSSFLYPEIVKLALKWKPEMPPPRFFLAFVAKSKPHHTEIVELNDFDVSVGEKEVRESFLKLQECIKTGVWKKVPEVRKVSLPGWYLKKNYQETGW